MTIAMEVRARRRLPSPAKAREIRLAAGVSQGRIAAELGVATITVSRWETGSRAPKGQLLVAYVGLLDHLAELTRSAS
jgi:DNA-binding transcriptional regulator YiaG